MRGLSQQRDALERERWSVLKRARQEGDRCVALAARLGDREAQLQSARSELSQVRCWRRCRPSQHHLTEPMLNTADQILNHSTVSIQSWRFDIRLRRIIV